MKTKIISGILLTLLFLNISVFSATNINEQNPHIETIQYKVYDDEEAMTDALLIDNELDMMPGSYRNDLLADVIAAGYNVTFDTGWRLNFFTINCRDYWPPEAAGGPNGKTPGEPVQPLNDSRFRVAMTYMWGIDRKNNTLTAYSSLYFALESIIPPGQAYWHDPNKHMPDTDWDIARQILQDAGYYVNTTDNRLYNPDGTQVRDIDVEYSASTFWEDIAGDFVASMNGFFEYIGATTGPAFRLLELDFMTLIYKLTVYHDFDMICLGFDGLGENPDWLYDVFHSRNVGWYLTNYGGFDHPEADELLEIIMFSQNVTEIKEACYEFQHLFNEWYPWFLVCSKYLVHTYDSGLMNIIESPGFSSNNAWTWRLMHWNTSASGGSVRYALADEPNGLNPLYGGKGSWEIMNRIFDDLLELNPETHDHIPWQAYYWTIECGSWPELGILHGKKFSFRMRNDMYWQDSGAYKDLNDNDELDLGEPVYIFPVTSEDVKFAWNFLKKYQPSKFSDAGRSIVYVETDGPWEVIAYLDATTIWSLNDLTASAKVLPKHIWEKVDEKIENEEWVSPEDFHPWEISYEEWTGLSPPPQYPFMKALIGDGPFVFDYYDDSARRGQVHSNDVYWVDGPIKSVVDAQYIALVDKNTECIIDPIEYNVIVSNYGYKMDGELANKTADVKIYEEGIVTRCETDVQVNIFDGVTLGPYLISALCKGACNITIEIIQDSTVIDTYTHIIHGTIKEDINVDHKVRVDDALAAALAFGSDPLEAYLRWDPRCDMNDDFKIRVDDILTVALAFGWG